jgi:uncharacterized protein YndB with AHSA1/START domain
MSNDYEKTFSVHVPPERAFRAFTDPHELEQWFTPMFDADAEEGAPGVKADAASPGGDVHFEVTQIKGDELLCYRQWAADPETGIDVTVVFEPVEGGRGSPSRTPASAATPFSRATRFATACSRTMPI